MKANKTMKGQAVPNHRRRKDKKEESKIDSAAHNQTLIQQKQLNDRNHHISINTNTNVNRLNSPIKRHRLANWIKKEDPTISCLQETHLIDRNKHWLRVKTWKKPLPSKNRQEWQYLDKIDFKLTLIK
jgi:hypothetical protein